MKARNSECLLFTSGGVLLGSSGHFQCTSLSEEQESRSGEHPSPTWGTQNTQSKLPANHEMYARATSGNAVHSARSAQEQHRTNSTVRTVAWIDVEKNTGQTVQRYSTVQHMVSRRVHCRRMQVCSRQQTVVTTDLYCSSSMLTLSAPRSLYLVTEDRADSRCLSFILA